MEEEEGKERGKGDRVIPLTMIHNNITVTIRMHECMHKDWYLWRVLNTVAYMHIQAFHCSNSLWALISYTGYGYYGTGS